MSDSNRTMFEHEGRIFHVKRGYRFPDMYINDHCCFGKCYRTNGYSTYNQDEFIKYAIALRTAYAAAFLNDAMALLKQRESVICLITPFGSLPYSIIWPSNEMNALVSLIKLGETSIA